MVGIGNFSSTSFENFDINLVQKEVDGGSVSVDQIVEAIGKTPNASSIVISGLKQDTFEYFIERYGKLFEATITILSRIVAAIMQRFHYRRKTKKSGPLLIRIFCVNEL